MTELAEATGFLVSSTHNMLSTFELGGLVARNPQTGRYRLGLKLLEYSNTISSSSNLLSIAKPYMNQITLDTGERCMLAQLYDDQVIYLGSSEPHSTMRNASVIGICAPLYCTGVGKAILACLPAAQQDRIIKSGFQRFTAATICDETQLRQELSVTLQRGYAIDNMEHEYGIKCVAVPLFNAQRECFAAFSVTGPSLRFSNERIPELAATLLEAARKINKLLT